MLWELETVPQSTLSVEKYCHISVSYDNHEYQGVWKLHLCGPKGFLIGSYERIWPMLTGIDLYALVPFKSFHTPSKASF
jgi:hypothetical protein